jgi:hypothetical protein
VDLVEGIGKDSWGIKSFLTPVNIVNFGIISGELVGINVNGGGSLNNNAGGSVTGKTGVAVIMTSGGTETIVNSGTIFSSGSAAIAFRDNTSGSVTNNPGGVIARWNRNGNNRSGYHRQRHVLRTRELV